MISPLLKPVPRAKKQPKPIARTSRPARVRKTASGRARHAADLEWAKAVRESGPCAALGTVWHPFGMIHRSCTSSITAAHIVSRRYAATRHTPANGLPLCAAMHVYMTAHPLEWEAFCIARIGRVAYNSLKETALRGTK